MSVRGSPRSTYDGGKLRWRVRVALRVSIVSQRICDVSEAVHGHDRSEKCMHYVT